jgi:hypothetical protein
MNTAKGRMRVSFALLGAAVVAVIVSYAVDAGLEARRWREQEPRLAVDSMVKALRTHHKQTGRFPTDFRELEAMGAVFPWLIITTFTVSWTETLARSGSFRRAHAVMKDRPISCCSLRTACGGGRARLSLSTRLASCEACRSTAR